jgi:nitroimidazol reductase NimA-like FMN-containing flavoprotein (pyridoxamine 5'-phosphate oxidase superfamily)
MTTPPHPYAETRRRPELARYDRRTIESILDEAFFCHVGFVHEDHPVVIPTIHVRTGNQLVFHGSPKSRLMKVLQSGDQVSVGVTLLDGLVLARSIFHHSMNYRSVVLFGRGRPVDDPTEKLEAMRTFAEKLLPGRWDEIRPPTEQEFAGTAMAALAINAASARVRTGPPKDPPADLDAPVWAGEVPFRLLPGDPIPAPDLAPGIEFPDHLRSLYD